MKRELYKKKILSNKIAGGDSGGACSKKVNVDNNVSVSVPACCNNILIKTMDKFK